MTVALVILSPSALPTARRVQAVLPGAELHGLAGRIETADVSFTDTAAHLRALFAAGTTIVGLCASGILIRALASGLGDKHAEPPVLAVALDGSSVVPLLGGHRGANRLARLIADGLGGVAALTTAGEVALGLALDAPPTGWTLANPHDAGPLMADLLAGAPVALDDPAGWAGWLRESALTFDAAARHRLRVTDRAEAATADTLVYHPPVLALGVGCERDAPPEELEKLALDTLTAEGLSPKSVACVVSLDLKADEAAVLSLAAKLGVPARFFPAAALEAESPRLATPSDTVFAEVGCHGVSEGAALAAVGTDGGLIVPKGKSRRATCAIARAAQPFDGAAVGRPRGRLFVVGIGPGKAAWRTPAVSAAVAEATDLVGYQLYLDLLGPAANGKARHQTELGEETERVRRALDLAGEGKSVALVCSGDAGIYALATLVYELLEVEDAAAWRTIDIVVEPGVSALQAAAAKAGAPIGHDFCTISLSNLLTPWDVIERRVEAAGLGDFVVSFYNPVSQRRREGLAKARDILLRHRPADTPVILARQLGRPEEVVQVVDLAQLTPDMADMLTLVMVGNSETRRLIRSGRTSVYTPRGYGAKRATPTT